MKKNFSNVKSRAHLIDRLLAIVNKKKSLFIIVFGVFLVPLILYSILLPRYISEAMILVRQKLIAASANVNYFSTSENESFLSTQLSLLSSRVIITNTLSSFLLHTEPTEKDIETLRSSISLKRLPLNNLILIKLRWKSKKETKKLLSEFINSYKAWHEMNLANEISFFDDLFLKKIKPMKNELNEAENELAQWIDRNEELLIDNNEVKSELINKQIKYNREIKKENIDLTYLKIKKTELILFIHKKTGVKIDPNVFANQLSNIKNQLIEAKAKVLEVTESRLDEMNTLRAVKIEIKFLEDNLEKLIEKIFSEKEENDVHIKSRFSKDLIQIEMSIIDKSAKIVQLEKVAKKNSEIINQLNHKIYYKKRLENIIGVKEAGYLKLVQERDFNKAFLTNEKYITINVIYAPTEPQKSNTFFKMIGYAFITGFFMNILIIYFYIGKEE